MQLDVFLENMTPEVYHVLRESMELGKWPNGRVLTEEEREAGLQAIIVYEHQRLPESERVGYMPSSCKSTDSSPSIDNKETEKSILRFKDS